MNKEEILKEIEQKKGYINCYEKLVNAKERDIKEHKFHIAEMQEELKDLEQQLKDMEKKPNGVYYFTNDCGVVVKTFWCNDLKDNNRLIMGNCYITERIAGLKRDITLATQEYKRKVAEFNGDWQPKWGNGEQTNNTLELSYSTDKIWCYASRWYRDIEKEDMYFSDEVMENEQQLSELKTLYQKIINLTEEYKLEEKKWRES